MLSTMPISSDKNNKYPFLGITTLLCLFVLLISAKPIFAVDLLAEYRFEGNLQPIQAGSTLAPWTAANVSNHCNSSTGFTTSEGSWWWLSTGCSGGGGFKIDVDGDISASYSIGVRFQFDTINSGYIKIIDFKDMMSDDGFYFHNHKIRFYPTNTDGPLSYQANTTYDLVVTRDGGTNTFTAYIVNGGVVSQEFEINDAAGKALPFVTSDNKTRLGFFFDDTIATGSEATNGGKVYNVRIWRNALTADQIQDAMSNHSPVITSNGGGAAASTAVFDREGTKPATPVTTVTATDSDSDPLIYTLNGGVDDSYFTLDPTSGVLVFNAPPQFDTPNDDDGDNFYEITIQVDDGKGGTVTQNLTVEVAPIAKATPDTYSISQGGTLAVPPGGVLVNDYDENGTPMTAVLDTDVSNGTLSLNSNGSFTYTPSGGFFGTDTFLYHADDGTFSGNIVTATITVNPVNHPPVGTDDTYQTPEDTELTVNAAKGVLVNDSDPDVHDHLTAVISSVPGHGSVTLNLDGSLTYTPTDPNYNGPDSFVYTLSDGHLNSLVTVNITILAVNDVPVAQADGYTIAEDTTLNATKSVLDNDFDPDNAVITAVKVLDPTNGTLHLNTNGSFQYVPNPDFNGEDSFTYHATDGDLSSADVTVTLRVTTVNDPPRTLPDSYNVHEDTGLTVDADSGLLNNDSDPEHNQMRVTLQDNVSNGTLHLNPNGSFDYTPDPNYNGTDSFTYQVSDGQDTSNTETVTLTIDAVNDTPVIIGDAYTTLEDTLLTVDKAKGLLANDSDPDGDSFMALLVDSPTHGTIQFLPDGSFSYLPALNYTGADSFTYKLSDGQAESTTATVKLTVRAVNDTPLGGNDSYATQEDTVVTIDAVNGVLANDIDLDGDILKAIALSPPANGTLHLNVDGSFSYSPKENFSGSDSFTYTAYDGNAYSVEPTVTINVHAVNDAPVSNGDAYIIGRDGFLQVLLNKGLLVNDHDVDHDTLMVIIVSSVNHGALKIFPDGRFTYKPAPGYFGVDHFTYKAYDGKAYGNEATVSITVTHVNVPPLPNGNAYTVAQDAVLNVTVANGLLSNDLDVDGDTLLLNAIPTSVLHGTLQLKRDGAFTYTPDPGYNGPDSFSYTVTDGTVESSPVIVSLTVTSVNYAPLASKDAYRVPQDGVLSIFAPGVLGNDLDLNGDKLITLPQSNPFHGTLNQDNDGGFIYTPDPGFQGSDSYTYTASDGAESSNPVTVTIDVHQTNQAPSAATDAYYVHQDSTLQIGATHGVLANDTDSDGDTLLITSLTRSANHGNLHMNQDGSFFYTPDAGYVGADSFSYAAYDGSTHGNTVTVSLTVTHVNHAPNARVDTYNVPGNSVLTVGAAKGLLMNDEDVDGDTLTVQLQTPPSHGTLQRELDGSFSYTPETGYDGTDSYTYTAFDSLLNSNEVTVTLNVHLINQAPQPVADNYAVTANTVLQVNDISRGVLANDTDPDGDQLTAILDSGPSHGSVHLEKDGRFSYAPDSGYEGLDSFQYKASDGADSTVQTVTINVRFIYHSLTVSITQKSSGQGKVTSQPIGIDCGSTCTADFAKGTDVILTATSEHGSTFVGWSGACSGTDFCTVNMSAEQAVSAEFYYFPWSMFVPVTTGAGRAQ